MLTTLMDLKKASRKGVPHSAHLDAVFVLLYIYTSSNPLPTHSTTVGGSVFRTSITVGGSVFRTRYIKKGY